MWVAPIRSGLGEQKKNDFNSAMADWHSFVDETEAHYGVNMGVLTKTFLEEHEKYFLQASLAPLFYFYEREREREIMRIC